MSEKDIVIKIIKAVGGKDNIKNYEHCATRLRVILHDNSLLDEKEAKAIEGVQGYFFQTGQHQFILGTGKVNVVFEEMKNILGNANTSDWKEDVYANLNPLQKMVRILADILLPLIPALVTTGLLMGIRGLILNMGVKFDDTTLALFGMLTDTAFAFLPVLIAYSATKKFGGNPIIGIVVGLMMVAPQLPNAWVVANGGATPMMFSVFGLQIPLVGYQGSIIPAMFAGYLVSVIEKKLRKVIPQMIDLIVTPFLTILVSITLMLLILGPITHQLEILLTSSISYLLALPLGIGYIVFGAVQQLIVITGLHHALGIVEIGLIESTGANPLQPLFTASMAGQFGAAIAVATMLKDPIKKSNTFSTSFSTLFGITEPLLFGTNMQYNKVFMCGMAGGAVGGFLTYILNLKASGMGITFVPGLLLYTKSPIDIVKYLGVIIVAFSVSFFLTKLFAKINE